MRKTPARPSQTLSSRDAICILPICPTTGLFEIQADDLNAFKRARQVQPVAHGALGCKVSNEFNVPLCRSGDESRTVEKCWQ
jgi:hypothetical protein